MKASQFKVLAEGKRGNQFLVTRQVSFTEIKTRWVIEEIAKLPEGISVVYVGLSGEDEPFRSREFFPNPEGRDDWERYMRESKCISEVKLELVVADIPPVRLCCDYTVPYRQRRENGWMVRNPGYDSMH